MADGGIFLMSRKERETLVLRVKVKEMKLVEAAEVLSISYRRNGCSRRSRRFRRYRESGAAGLVHRSRGVACNRRLSDEVRTRIVKFYRGDYKGFGPLLYAELLSSHQIRVDHAGGAAVAYQRGIMARKPEKEERSPGVERAAVASRQLHQAVCSLLLLLLPTASANFPKVWSSAFSRDS